MKEESPILYAEECQSYVPNIAHQYIVILQRPTHIPQFQPDGL